MCSVRVYISGRKGEHPVVSVLFSLFSSLIFQIISGLFDQEPTQELIIRAGSEALLEESENRLHRSAGDFQIMTARVTHSRACLCPSKDRKGQGDGSSCRMAVDH